MKRYTWEEYKKEWVKNFKKSIQNEKDAMLRPYKKQMMCRRCKSENIEIQTINEKKPISSFAIFIGIICAFFSYGLSLILIPLTFICRGNKTVSYGVCKECGKRWKIY